MLNIVIEVHLSFMYIAVHIFICSVHMFIYVTLTEIRKHSINCSAMHLNYYFEWINFICLRFVWIPSFTGNMYHMCNWLIVYAFFVANHTVSFRLHPFINMYCIIFCGQSHSFFHVASFQKYYISSLWANLFHNASIRKYVYIVCGQSHDFFLATSFHKWPKHSMHVNEHFYMYIYLASALLTAIIKYSPVNVN